MEFNDLRQASILLDQNCERGSITDNMKLKEIVRNLNGLIISLTLQSCPHTPKHTNPDECQNISIRIAYMKSLLLKWFNHLIATDTDPYTSEICSDPLGLEPDTEVYRKTITKNLNGISVTMAHLKFTNYSEVIITGNYDKYTFRIIYDSHNESMWTIKSKPYHKHDVLIWEPMISFFETQLSY